MTTTYERLLTADEVAQALQVSAHQVRDMARAGALPALKVGREWRFRPSSVDAWAIQREAQWRRSQDAS